MDDLLGTLKTYIGDQRVLALATAGLVGLSLKLLASKKPRRPPGPPVWPVLGSLPSLRNDLQVFIDFAEKYGDVYYLQLGLFGHFPTIVLNNMDLIREALLQKADDFAGRNCTPTFEIIGAEGRDLAFGDFTPEWRYQRKVAHVALRKYATGNHFQELLERNVEMISEVFRKAGDKPQDVHKTSSLIFYNIIASFCFGKKYEMEDHEFNHIRQMLDDGTELFAGFFMADLWPVLRHIPTPAVTQVKKVAAELQAFVDTQIAEHKKNFDESELRDLTDYIIHSEAEMKKSGLEEYQVDLSDVHYRQIVLDMFTAGTDTSRNTLTWALLFLSAHPEIQKKAQKEIDDNIGRNGKITSQNRTNIPFSEAIIYEALRMRTPAPLGLPHKTTCDTSVGGYDIPKGTQVFINLVHIHQDPKEWENPEQFNPERFLDDAGNLGPKPNAFLPFSAGRRSCVGEALAKSELHIILGSLLQRFNFSPPPGKQIDLVPKPNLLFTVPNDAKLMIQER